MSYRVNPTPRRLGNVFCFWYNKETGQPRIVIGPDWVFSVIEMILMNGIAGYFIATTDRVRYPYLFAIGFLTLLLHDIFFIWLIT